MSTYIDAGDTGAIDDTDSGDIEAVTPSGPTGSTGYDPLEDTVEVRRDGALSGVVGVVAAGVALLYLGRALGGGSALDVLVGLVVGGLAVAHLAMLVDSRAPLMVLDPHGVRVRRGKVWHGVAWPEVARVEHTPRASMLRDGSLDVTDVDGRGLTVRLSLSTRLVGANWHELTDALVDLAGGLTHVVEHVEDIEEEPSEETDSDADFWARDGRRHAGFGDLLATSSTSATADEDDYLDFRDETASDVADEDSDVADEPDPSDEHDESDDSKDPEPVAEAEDSEVDPRVLPDDPEATAPSSEYVVAWGTGSGTGNTVDTGTTTDTGDDSFYDYETDHRDDTPEPDVDVDADTADDHGAGDDTEVTLPVVARVASPTPGPRRDVVTARRSEVLIERPARASVTAEPSAAAYEPVGTAADVPAMPGSSTSETMTVVFDDALDVSSAPVLDPVIGPVLASARTRVGLGVDQLAERTRIRPHVIEAMEADDFGPCGGDFYARGHLRTLARVLGVDVQPLLDSYEERYSHAPIDARSVFSAELATGASGSIRGTRGGLNWSVLVAAVMVVVLVWSVARLLMDGPVPLSDQPILNGSPGRSAALTSGTPAKVPVTLTAATGGARVIVRDGNRKVVFDDDVPFGQTAKLQVTAPVRVSSTDGGLVVSVDGEDQGALGETGQDAQEIYVAQGD